MRESLVVLNKVLAPIAPHIAHELWQHIGESGDVIDAGWPAVDTNALKSDTLKLVIQVNGKLRSEIEVATSSSREEIETAALQDPKALRFIDGKPVRKVIIVPGKLVNIVV
jgi:leucyl-tRNA synthetase